MAHMARRTFRSVAIGCLALSAAAQSLVFAQSSGGDFAIARQTIDNGGGRATGGDFSLTGTIAQPDATTPTARGGNFQLTGGFWAKGTAVSAGELLFSDGFEG